MTEFSRDALFQCDTNRAVELTLADAPSVQAFFERNPEFFVLSNGQAPTPSEAVEELQSLPPENWSFTHNYAIGFIDPTGSLFAMATVVSDALAPGVWHIGFFILETKQHGTGVAKALFDATERWARSLGAQWLRLSVIKGNTRAERFWESRSFQEIRQRMSACAGPVDHTFGVMIKPLTDAPIGDYLRAVARDRPESDR